jgi:hypothetical protein
MQLHPEVFGPNQRAVLTAVAATTSRWEAYLAGGMAAALQLGHRRSADFDWFTKKTIEPGTLLADIKSLGFDVDVRQNQEGTFLGRVANVDFSVFRYRYDTVGPAVPAAGCKLASLTDIGAMKLAAISQRAEKRDYTDLHAIITDGGSTLGGLITAWGRKYGKDPTVPLKALTYFKDAEGTAMPVMLTKTTWGDVKKGLVRAVERYLSRDLGR